MPTSAFSQRKAWNWWIAFSHPPKNFTAWDFNLIYQRNCQSTSLPLRLKSAEKRKLEKMSEAFNDDAYRWFFLSTLFCHIFISSISIDSFISGMENFFMLQNFCRMRMKNWIEKFLNRGLRITVGRKLRTNLIIGGWK